MITAIFITVCLLDEYVFIISWAQKEINIKGSAADAAIAPLNLIACLFYKSLQLLRR